MATGQTQQADHDGFGDDGPIVGVPWLLAHRDDPVVLIVDPRPAHAYAASHIPGAVHLDLYQPELKLHDSSPAERDRFHTAAAAAFGQIGVGLDPATPTRQRILFTEENSGSFAARGVWLLDELGHGGGAMLDGGLIAWVDAGGELTRDVPEVTPATFIPAPVPELLATADEIRDAITNPAGAGQESGGMTVLDTRAVPEYAIATIPTSVHLDWIDTLAPDGAFRSPAELRTLYAAAGLPAAPDRRVVTFCGSGYRAAHTYVVLRALGYSDVANYSPSWGEWGRRPDLPTERPTINPYQ